MANRLGTNDPIYDLSRIGGGLNPLPGSPPDASLDATAVGYGSDTNTLTGDVANFHYSDTTKLLSVKINESWVQETKYLVVDADGRGDYTTLQAAMNAAIAAYSSGIAAEYWTIIYRTPTTENIVFNPGAAENGIVVHVWALGGAALYGYLIAGVYGKLHLHNLRIEYTAPSGNNDAALAASNGNTVYLYHCTITRTQSPPTIAENIVVKPSGGTVEMYHCTVTQLISSPYSVFYGSGTVQAYDCKITSFGGLEIAQANAGAEYYFYYCQLSGSGNNLFDTSGGGNVYLSRCQFNTNVGGTYTILDGDVPPPDAGSITPSMLANASAQYKYLVSGATPFAYAESAGALNIASGKTLTVVETGTAALGAGTLTVSTTNDVTGATHTHAITSSSNPGAAASILASDSNGGLRLTGIGINAAAVPGSVGNQISLSVTGTGYAPTTFYWYGNNSVVNVTLATNSQSDWRAYGMEAAVNSNSAGTVSNIFGGSFLTLHFGDGTISNQVSGRFVAQSSKPSGTSTTTNLKVGQFSINKTGAGTWSAVTTKLLSVEVPVVSAGTLSGTTLTGVHIENMNAANSGTWTSRYAVNSAGGQWALLNTADEILMTLTGHTTQAATNPIIKAIRNDAAAGVSQLMQLTALGSGADGDGGSVLMSGKSSTTAAQSMGALKWLWASATHASRKARIVGTVYDTAERTWLQVDTDGTQAYVGIGGVTPTARLHLPAGGTAANTAPLKLTTQASPLTVVEQGTFELVGNSLQFTQLAKRRGVVMSQSTRTSDFQLVSSASESAAIITAEHGAGYLEVGKTEEIVLRGTLQKDVGAPTNTLTIRVKYAGATIHTITSSNSSIAANTVIEIVIVATCRSTGATGTLQINSIVRIDGDIITPAAPSLVTVDTTTAQNTTVTAQFTNSSATNNLVIHQGRVLCIEPNK